MKRVFLVLLVIAAVVAPLAHALQAMENVVPAAAGNYTDTGCRTGVNIDTRTCADISVSGDISNAKSYHDADSMTDLDPRLSSGI